MTRLAQTRPSLLLRLRRLDDRDAWSDFVRHYGPAVFGYYRRRGLQEADAVDLTQEVFRLVSRHIARFDYRPESGRFRSWLFTIASRVRLKFQERSQRLPQSDISIDDLKEEAESDEDWQDSLRRRLYELAFERVCNEASATTVSAFTRTAIDGISGEEVAEELGITRAAVYLARARVLAKLRQIVAELAAWEVEQ